MDESIMEEPTLITITDEDVQQARELIGKPKMDHLEIVLRQQTEQMSRQCEQLKALTDEVENLRKQMNSAGGGTGQNNRDIASALGRPRTARNWKKKKYWAKQRDIEEEPKLVDLYCELSDSCQRGDQLDVIKALVDKIDAEGEQSRTHFNPDWRDTRKIEPNSTYVVNGCFLHRLFQDKEGSNIANRLEIARYLVDERGATLDIRQDFWGWTPLIMVSRRGYREFAEFFIERGASIDRKDFDGCTPLIHAAKHCHIGIVELLLDKGAFIDHQCKCDGWTALMWASIKGSLEIVKLLLKRGANLDLTSKNESTALMLASDWSKMEVVQLLSDYHL